MNPLINNLFSYFFLFFRHRESVCLTFSAVVYFLFTLCQTLHLLPAMLAPPDACTCIQPTRSIAPQCPMYETDGWWRVGGGVGAMNTRTSQNMRVFIVEHGSPACTTLGVAMTIELYHFYRWP